MQVSKPNGRKPVWEGQISNSATVTHVAQEGGMVTAFTLELDDGSRLTVHVVELQRLVGKVSALQFASLATTF